MVLRWEFIFFNPDKGAVVQSVFWLMYTLPICRFFPRSNPVYVFT